MTHRSHTWDPASSSGLNLKKQKEKQVDGQKVSQFI